MNKSAVKETDYGNWVPKRFIYLFSVLTVVFLLLSFLFWFSIIPALLCIVVALYFVYARYLFSAKGGDIQNQIWKLPISNLYWNGKGQALDIGCGNGPLTIKLAQAFPEGKIIGIDFWGKKWEYSRKACEANAKDEGVNERTVFQKASASKLPYDDGFFDAVVSNFCFHEVSDSKDKREVIREALRVVKKGGGFSFQDIFLFKQVYGDIDQLLGCIKSWGIEKVEFIETRNAPFIPVALKLPFMLGQMGIIKGIK